MNIKPRQALRSAIGVAVLVMALAPYAVAARSAAEPTPTRLEVLLAPPPQPDLPYAVLVRLSTESGSAVTDAEVSVFLNVSFFGGRSALLGQATTDTAGEARIPISPDRVKYEVRVKFAGNDDFAASESVTTITVPPAGIGPAREKGDSSLLSGVHQAAPKLIAVFVMVVWALFIVGFIWVMRRIHHHGSRVPLDAARR